MNYLLYFQAKQTQTDSWFTMIPFVLVFLVFYFLMVRPNLKQQKQHQKFIESLKKGDKVITSSGIWGEIDGLEANVVHLRVHDKTKLTVSRSAIDKFQTPAADGATKAG